MTTATQVKSFRLNTGAPYRHVRHALRAAYAMEAEDAQVTCLLGQLVAGRPGDGLNLLDRAAQAALVLAFARRTLPERHRTTLEAYYRDPTRRMLAARKDTDCRFLGSWLYDELGGRTMHRPYVWDVVRGWSGLERESIDEVWALRLEVTTRTLRNWRRGGLAVRHRGIEPVLDAWRQQALHDLGEAMWQAGMVETAE